MNDQPKNRYAIFGFAFFQAFCCHMNRAGVLTITVE